MQINNIDGLILPKKSDEEFLKINFDSLFFYDFTKAETYEFDIMGLETIVDEEKYESVLFDISRSLDNKQKIITLNGNFTNNQKQRTSFGHCNRSCPICIYCR